MGKSKCQKRMSYGVHETKIVSSRAVALREWLPGPAASASAGEFVRNAGSWVLHRRPTESETPSG